MIFAVFSKQVAAISVSDTAIILTTEDEAEYSTAHAWLSLVSLGSSE